MFKVVSERIYRSIEQANKMIIIELNSHHINMITVYCGLNGSSILGEIHGY